MSVRPPQVTFFTRVGCHLCDDARAAVMDAVEATGAAFIEVDIDSAEDLTRRYGLTIPVVEVDGVEVARYSMTAAALEKSIRERQ